MAMNDVSATSASGAASGPHGAQGHRQLPDQVVSALADKLGMSADDLKSKLASADDPRKALD
jgi:hypothetical protein